MRNQKTKISFPNKLPITRSLAHLKPTSTLQPTFNITSISLQPSRLRSDTINSLREGLSISGRILIGEESEDGESVGFGGERGEGRSD